MNKTPTFIRMEKDGLHEMVCTYLGELTDITLFLASMVEAYGIKQEDGRAKEGVSPPNEPRLEGVLIERGFKGGRPFNLAKS